MAHHPTHSLIFSYLSTGMQPLILKNALSCNTLEKPRSTLSKNKTLKNSIVIQLVGFTGVLKQGKEVEDLWRFGVIKINMSCSSDLFIYVFFDVFHRAVAHAQKRQACQGFHSSVMFSTSSRCGGIASCFVAPCMFPCKV